MVQTDYRDGIIDFYILNTILSLRELLARFIALQVLFKKAETVSERPYQCQTVTGSIHTVIP